METERYEVPQMPPAPPGKKRRWWPFVLGGVLLLGVGAAIGGETSAPPAPSPSPRPSVSPVEVAESPGVSDAELVRISAGTFGIPPRIFVGVNDSTLDEVGRSVCEYVKTTDTGQAVDNEVSEDEALFVAHLIAEELGITPIQGSKLAGVFIGVYCPNVTIGF